MSQMFKMIWVSLGGGPPGGGVDVDAVLCPPGDVPMAGADVLWKDGLDPPSSSVL